MTPTIGVLSLQGDVREHLRALEACAVAAQPIRRPGELTGVDALVLPGGESTTMGNLLARFELEEPIRERLAEGMPAYGSCAGMILLAKEILDGRADQRSFGALDVTVRRNAFGRQVDSFETGLEMRGIDDPVRGVFIRAPWVESAAEHVEVLARVPDVADAGAAAGRIVAARQRSVLATSFHPELTGDARVHQLFVDLVRQH